MEGGTIMTAAVGVRIGLQHSTARDARKAAWWHQDHNVWLTNKRHRALRPGTPVIASACGTWLFLRGVVTGDPGPWDGTFEYAYPVKYEPTVYLGDAKNPVLAGVARMRSMKALTAVEYEKALTGLRPDKRATRS